MREQRQQLANYAAAIAMWMRGFDTAAMAEQLGIAESLAARWVSNFRELARAPERHSERG